MNWTLRDDNTWISDNHGLIYYVMDGGGRVDFPMNKFVVSRDVDEELFPSHKSGYLNKQQEVIIGFAMFSACGASEEMLFDSIEQAKMNAQKDFERIYGMVAPIVERPLE